jgi:hypothetical protein
VRRRPAATEEGLGLEVEGGSDKGVPPVGERERGSGREVGCGCSWAEKDGWADEIQVGPSWRFGPGKRMVFVFLFPFLFQHTPNKSKRNQNKGNTHTHLFNLI